MAKKKNPHKISAGQYGDKVEGYIKSIVVDHEYATGKSNNDNEYAEYESLLDKVDGLRSEKNYSWQSDIALGYFLSHLLTDASSWAMQYFSSRDFCNVYLEGDDPKDKEKSQAVKKLINKTLNMPQIYHYQKYIRARVINWLFGQVYILCYWEKKERTRKVAQQPVQSIREDGNAVSTPQPDKEVTDIIFDRFNYEVLDPRNVFTDYSYTYSIQQKPWVIIRSETNFDAVEADKEALNYFNLDRLSGAIKSHVWETDTAKDTYNRNTGKSPFTRTPVINFDLLQRFGKMWAIVEEVDDDGIPTKVKPGYDETNERLEGAELVECITTFAVVGNNSILIRFDPTPNIDSKGNPFKPIVRGVCYVHPSRDTGLSDGKNLREIDTAINDTFNISNDRVMLATMPTFMGRKMALEDNPTVYIEPEHIIELEDPQHDLQELQIRDNIAGAMQQIGVLKNTGSELDSIWPTTQGGFADKVETATAVAGAESRSNARGGFKSLTFEYTFLVEFYWQIIQMTYRFCDAKTALKLMGQFAYIFDPDGDYTFIPLSQALEAEHSKRQKTATLDQMMGRVVGMVKLFPKPTAKIVAKILEMQFLEMGSEYQDVASILKELTQAKPVEEGKGAGSSADGKPEMTSNQNGLPVGGAEQGARDAGNAIMGNM